MMPDEHVAGAGGGQPGVAGGRRRARRRRASATTVVGPLSSTTHRVGGQAAGGGDPIGARPFPGEQAVLAVVRREHGRRPRRSRSTGARPVAIHARANSPSPSITTGTLGGGDELADRGDGGVLAPEPGAEDEARGSGRGRRARPSPSRTSGAVAARPRRRDRRPIARARQRDHAATGALRGRRREVGGARSSRPTGDDPHGGRPLVRVAWPRPPATTATSAGSTRWARARLVSSPMSATSTLAGERRARRRTAARASARRT